MTASENVLVAAKTLVKALDVIPAKKGSNVGTVQEKLLPVQTFSKHILYFMSMYYKDEGQFEKCRTNPMF